MSNPSPEPGTWHIVLRRVAEPAEQKEIAKKSTGIVVISLLLTAAGVVLGLAGNWSGWLLAAAGLLAAVIWVVNGANSRGISKLNGDDLISILVAEEGVVGQGGLAIAWDEISGIAYEWTKTVVTGKPATQIGAGLTEAAMNQAGMETTAKVIQIHLKDFRAVKARATTKIQRFGLFGPVLGEPGYLHVGQAGQPPEAVRELLAALTAQAERHAVPVTRRG